MDSAIREQVMSKEESLLEYWRELPPEAQDKVVEFARLC
jgi:hypothetical protein